MSLQILVSHTGERLLVNPTAFGSLDSFKSWLSKASSVSPADQILLTASGKQAKQQALLVEKEIFVYDRELVSSGSKARESAKTSHEPSIFKPGPPPGVSEDRKDISSWQRLFAERQQWATEVARECRLMADEVAARSQALVTMRRAVSVAVENLRTHVRTLEQRYGEAKKWADGLSEEQDAMLADWANTQLQLSRLPADSAFLRFLPKLRSSESDSAHSETRENINLDGFVASSTVHEATVALSSSRKSVQNQLKDLGNKVAKVVHDAAQLVALVGSDQDQSSLDLSRNAIRLQEEIDVFANKVTSDLEHVQGLTSQPNNLMQASKRALLHTKNYLPFLEEYATEMGDMVRLVHENSKEGPLNALDKLRKIATIEAAFAKVINQISQLGIPREADEALGLLALLSQLPYIYGTLLVEAVRRREWSDRLRDESSMLAEDIAGYREEEVKRRRKWFKSIGNLIEEDAAVGDALNFEVNVRSENREWPSANREDSSTYIHALSELGGMEEAVKELSEAMRDLDRPTKRQVKKAKGFKMGSFHETSSGRGSFLMRENDELRIAKDANSKLEEELRAQKSRIRKLEDLLHKQGQAGRANPGNLFQVSAPMQLDTENLATSPKEQSSLRRKSSASSPHNRPLEEKELSRRIANLEAELMTERQKNQNLQQQVQSKTTDEAKIKADVEEANSTKKDLMENMEAQQREFGNERRSLEEELDKYKMKLEEFEEEVDRLLESRDNAKLTIEEKERVAEQELQELKREKTKLEHDISNRNEQQQEHLQTLRTVHSNLTAETGPTDLTNLINTLDDLVGRSTRHIKELEQAIGQSKSDRESMQNAMDRQDKQMADSKNQLKELEETITTLRADHASEKARADAMSVEVEDGRLQLRTLRAKFAEGETGSESLQQRVEEQAARASNLATALAESKSHVNSLDVELSNLQRRYKKLQINHDNLDRRLENRSAHDRELTSRLVGHNGELHRLLESLGLSIIEKDGAMAIQRTSKLNNASTELSQLGVAANSVASIQGFTNGSIFDFSPSSHLSQWMQSETADEESMLFQQFLQKVDEFNYNTFSEAIIKLRRDIEWTGKKWKSEARGYRDKYHRAQTEGMEKIAFRSFKEGDLALFLPTRNQVARPWAAFNVGAPHYFLREQDSHKLQNREWLVARISKIEERVVNLSKTVDSLKATDGRSLDDENSEGGVCYEDDNPFELSDGLRWYLLEASEERNGAPATPGLGKTTVASANVDAKGSIRMKKTSIGTDASSKLNKNLESRRSSTSSKRNSVSINREGSSDSPSIRPSSANHAQTGSQATHAANGSDALGIEAAKSSNIEQHPSKAVHSPSKPAADSESLRRNVHQLDADDNSTARLKRLGPGQNAAIKTIPAFSYQQPVQPDSNTPRESVSRAAKSTAFESLWSVDLNLGSPRKKK